MDTRIRWWLLLLTVPIILRLLGTYAILSGPWSLVVGVLGPPLSLLSAACALWLASQGAHRVALMVMVLLNAWLALEDVRFNTTQNPQGIKVVTWNTALGYSDQHRCVQRVLAEHEPHILALQEVREAGLQGIATALDMSCTWAGYFPQPKSNGLGLCVPKNWTVRLAQQRPYSRSNPYAYLFAEVRPPTGQAINVMNVHLQSPELSRQQQKGVNTRTILGHTTARQIWQLFEVMRVAQDLDDPLLITGDFNSTPNTWVHGQLRAAFVDAHRARGQGLGATRWIGHMLPVRIDYLYASHALTWTGTTRSASGGGCSDHQPVVGQLKINP